MNHLSLFSGIGGIDLAAEWAGMKTVAFCEREPFPQKVLRKHWPDVPIYDDVNTLTKARLEADGIDTRTIDIISGGYPCQPFSNAGKRQGQADDRHLWPEVYRLLEKIRPHWFVGENVAGHITLGLDDVLSDMGNIGYAAQPFIIPAASVGAPHRRDRVFIVAHAESNIEGRLSIRTKAPFTGLACSGKNVGNAERRRCNRQSRGGANEVIEDGYIRIQEGVGKGRPAESQLGGVLNGLSDWLDEYRWPAALGQEQFEWEPPRVATGVKNRVGRLKAVGNAVNPVQIYPIMAAIKAINDAIEGI